MKKEKFTYEVRRNERYQTLSVYLNDLEMVREIRTDKGFFYPKLFWKDLGFFMFTIVPTKVLLENGFNDDYSFERSTHFHGCTGDYRTHFRSLNDFKSNILLKIHESPFLSKVLPMLNEQSVA